jgi:hypothetical protein
MEDEITDISINFLPAFCVGIGIGLFWAKGLFDDAFTYKDEKEVIFEKTSETSNRVEKIVIRWFVAAIILIVIIGFDL